VEAPPRHLELKRTAIAALALAVVAGVVWRMQRDVDRSGSYALPARIAVETVVSELASDLTADRMPPGVRRGRVAPRHGRLAESGPREAVIVPPGTRVPIRVRVPPEAFLTFSVGVEHEGSKDPSAAGIQFEVEVDGVARFSRVANPAARKDDRVWFDEEVDLGAEAGREVTISFVTTLRGEGRPAGTPGWSQARILRRRWRDRQPADPGRPNVLVLLVDTLRADRLGCYGATPTNSPALDRLAGEGTLFAQHVSDASWTMPSTGSILTGLHPPTHGALGNEGGHGLPSDVQTIAEAAREAGITTVGASANPLIARGTNFAQGFETFVELEIEGTAEEGKRPATADAVNEVFLRWLDRNRRHRFLAYLHYMEPHEPYTPPPHLRPDAPEGIRRSLAAGRLEPWLPAVRTVEGFHPSAAELAHLRRLYDAEVRSWDEELEVLLSALSARGLLESTVVIVTADHGEEFHEHGRLTHGFHLFDELVRVPLVIRGPGIPVGRVAEQTMGVDLFPTVSVLLGLDPPAGLPGQNVLAERAPRPAFSMTLSGRLPDGTAAEIVSMRTPQAKLIWAPSRDHRQLYDLEHDPGETVDRWETSPDGQTLAAVLAEWRASTPVTRVEAGPDGTFEDRLRALGYVQ
jgi:arylsulfatase A-like enzyme